MNLRHQQLKNLIRDLFGDDQVDLFRFSLTSLRDRIAYAAYHQAEAKRLMLPYTAGEGPKPGDPLEPFRTALTQAAAHVLACLQSLHACADICAHVVYFGVGSNLESKPIREQLVGVKTVLERLRAQPVTAALEGFVRHAEFEYLDAVVNRSKHRTVIYTGYTFEIRQSADDQAWHGVVLWHFERLGKSYPIRRAEEFLSGELDRQRTALSKVSEVLEAHLRCEWEEQKRIHEGRRDKWPPPRVPEPAEED